MDKKWKFEHLITLWQLSNLLNFNCFKLKLQFHFIRPEQRRHKSMNSRNTQPHTSPGPLTFCVACCCVGSLLTCHPGERRPCFDSPKTDSCQQLWGLTRTAPPASLSQPSMALSLYLYSVSPFLYFLSQRSCTEGSHLFINCFRPLPHLPHGCLFDLGKSLRRAALIMWTAHFLHCIIHLKILVAQIKSPYYLSSIKPSHLLSTYLI